MLKPAPPCVLDPPCYFGDVAKGGEIENNLARLRQKRGIPAAALARMAGVSRQTIYAMEAGSYIPNTAVALKLAQALETNVEDLFSLAGGASAPPLQTETVSLLPGGSVKIWR